MEYLLSAWLHEPLGNYWNMRNQQFIEGAVGSQMFGHPVSYYTVDYSAFYHVHDTRVKPSGINGIGEGPFLNGVDASDFASWFDPVTHFNVGPGGQVREQSGSGYIISPFDQIKMQTQWETNNDPPVDQLPGNRWFTIIAPIDNNVGTFFIRCEAADHIAFPTQCPVAGESFTGFTTNGVATDPNYTYDAPLYRFSFDPGANGGYLHGGYVPNMGVMINSLSILGFDVTHAKADFDFRTNVNNWYFESEPSFFWDRTVVVPGLPAIVTFSKEFPILACGTSPGTAITSLGMIQGNGAGASGWKITKSSDPSHYAVSGNNVITVGTVPCGASQMVEVQGTQSGGAAVKGQIHLHVNAGGSATIQALELSPRTFIATNGNKGTKIGNFAAQVSDGTFNAASGFALSNVGGCAGVSTNNNLFTTNGSELDIGTTDISGAGDKKICASAIDGSFSNSPQYKTFTITGILGPSLVVNGGSTVSVGQSVSITLSNGFGFNRDWIDIAPAGAGNDSSNWAYLNGSQGPPSSPVPLPATISLKANAPAGSYEVRYYENDTYTIGATTPLTVK